MSIILTRISVTKRTYCRSKECDLVNILSSQSHVLCHYKDDVEFILLCFNCCYFPACCVLKRSLRKNMSSCLRKIGRQPSLCRLVNTLLDKILLGLAWRPTNMKETSLKFIASFLFCTNVSEFNIAMRNI